MTTIRDVTGSMVTIRDTEGRAVFDAPAPAPSVWPATDDPLILTMRPRAHAYTVTASPGDDLAAVIADALTHRTTTGHEGRVLVLVEPGEYTATPPVASWLSLVGTTGDPADVTITGTTTSPQRGVLELRQGFYMEGITLRKPTGGHASLVYPIHCEQSSTKTLARCVLSAPDGYVYGANGGTGGTTTFYQCRFEVDTVTSHVTNIHGDSGDPDSPLTVQFIDTTSPGTLLVQQHIPEGPGTGETWAVGVTAGGLTVDHHVHVADSTIETISAPSQDADADWPVPREGLGIYDRRVYYGG